ncbi:MAG: hypothetical protein QF535_02875, partial [Anaerolineales bacterium]|nr:hypothetical protein [Anaerolineales bacterium]
PGSKLHVIGDVNATGSLYVGNNSIYFKEVQWDGLYVDVLNILGSTGTIIPMGDERHGALSAGTFTTTGSQQVTFTWSKAPDGFDTAPGFQGIAPVITFDGNDEQADTPDAAYWRRGDAINDFPFSIGVWVNLVDGASSQTLLAKNGNTKEQWWFHINDDETLELHVVDAGAGAKPHRDSDAAIGTGSWRFLVVTYGGDGGDTAMDGVTLYNNGEVEASTATNVGAYTAMETGAQTVDVGSRGETDSFFESEMAGGPLGPFFVQKNLTAAEVKQLYELGRNALLKSGGIQTWGATSFGNKTLVTTIGGKVGIGTSSPQYKLQVANASKAVNLSNVFFIDGDNN